jgi:hypothetical protein
LSAIKWNIDGIDYLLNKTLEYAEISELGDIAGDIAGSAKSSINQSIRWYY